MEIQRDEDVLINPYEDLRKCSLCSNFIYDNDGKVITLCNKRKYYHHICLNLLLKKIEMHSFLYSC